MSCSLLFMGCRHDDVLENDPNQSHNEDALKGKTFVLTQEQLEGKYAGNKNLNNILQKEFKTEGGLIKTNSEDEGQNGVYIDLDNIRVFESDQMHAITYYVEIGEQQETDEPQEVYNLMYFSKDYENYHVILFRYDFSQIPFQQFVANPELTLNVLGFVPLNDIENIYENISYSISHGLNSTSAVQTTSTSPVLFTEFINLADCIGEVTYPAQPCKDVNHHPYGDTRCPHRGTDMGATPPRTYLDFSKCGKSGGSPGGGTPGSGGGPGGSPSVGNPGGGWAPGGGSRWSNPIKFPIDVIDIGDLITDPVLVVNNYIKELSKLVKGNWPTIKIVYDNSESTVEKGYGYYRETTNGVAAYKVINTPLPVTNGMSSLDPKTLFDPTKPWYGKVTTMIHCHLSPNTRDDQGKYSPPMFSIGDIQSFSKLFAVSTLSPKLKQYFSILLVTKQGIYALTMKPGADPTNFNSLATNKEFANKMSRKLEDKYADLLPEEGSFDPMPTRADYEKEFLKFIKDNNLSLDLYKLDYNGTPINGDLNWKRFEL